MRPRDERCADGAPQCLACYARSGARTTGCTGYAMLDRLFRWRRRRRSQPTSRPDSADAALERYFTNAEEARQLFEGRAAADRLERRILVVYGAGAVGKSSLLKMYRLAARRRDVPVALAA